jgi:hypothetical protein
MGIFLGQEVSPVAATAADEGDVPAGADGKSPLCAATGGGDSERGEKGEAALHGSPGDMDRVPAVRLASVLASLIG